MALPDLARHLYLRNYARIPSILIREKPQPSVAVMFCTHFVQDPTIGLSFITKDELEQSEKMGIHSDPPREPSTNGVSTVIIDTSDENPGGAVDGTANTLTQADEWVYPHPTDFKLSNHAIDETKSLKVSSVSNGSKYTKIRQVAVVGAGMTGIIAGIFLPVKVPGIQLTIFDKNSDVVSREHHSGAILMTIVRSLA
ncbi:hypothetical protein MRB53_040042 [Persea americana]|nr:hypothetical protein MRB53_040042 [Persea americana]